MRGIFAAMAARMASRHLALCAEALLIGVQTADAKADAQELQDLVDSVDEFWAQALYNDLSEAPEGTAFAEIVWPTSVQM